MSSKKTVYVLERKEKKNRDVFLVWSAEILSAYTSPKSGKLRTVVCLSDGSVYDAPSWEVWPTLEQAIRRARALCALEATSDRPVDFVVKRTE